MTSRWIFRIAAALCFPIVLPGQEGQQNAGPRPARPTLSPVAGERIRVYRTGMRLSVEGTLHSIDTLGIAVLMPTVDPGMRLQVIVPHDSVTGIEVQRGRESWGRSLQWSIPSGFVVGAGTAAGVYASRNTGPDESIASQMLRTGLVGAAVFAVAGTAFRRKGWVRVPAPLRQ